MSNKPGIRNFFEPSTVLTPAGIFILFVGPSSTILPLRMMRVCDSSTVFLLIGITFTFITAIEGPSVNAKAANNAVASRDNVTAINAYLFFILLMLTFAALFV